MIFCFKHSAGGYIQTTTQVVFLLVLSKSLVHVTISAQFNECTFSWKPQSVRNISQRVHIRIGIFCSDFEYLPSNALDKITRSAENASCRAKKNQITCTFKKRKHGTNQIMTFLIFLCTLFCNLISVCLKPHTTYSTNKTR